MESAGCFTIGGWRVHPSLNQLVYEGKTRRLEPKVMDVLCALAADSGEVLSKERLIQAVWPDTFVTDEVLTNAISQIRKAFDDNPKEPRFIETIARRGYRLVAAVRFEAAKAPAVEALRASPESGDRVRSRELLPSAVGSRGWLRLVRAESAEAQETNPYPGLAAFTEREADCFFGREGEIQALWRRIEERKLLALIGPSGVGKTSFLRAGVIAARPQGWAAAYMTPGSSPALGLAQGLTRELAGDAPALQDLLGAVAELTARGGAQRLVAAVRSWRTRSREALLVIDQFEELFTLNLSDVQEAFAGLVHALVVEAGLHVALSLRDDFLIRCAEYPALAPVFKELTPLPPLQHGGLRRALEDPAAGQGYRFEDEALVDEIVAAVEGERGSLPLLAFAVSRLWEKRDLESRVLTRAAYREIGGVEGSLAGHAEATLERIPVDHHSVVREIFRNLVTAQGTRATLEREELLSVFPERATAEEVLRLLVHARLLTTYETGGKAEGTGHRRVEVVHESLLTAWPRLAHWRTQDQEGAQLRDELRQAARLWDQHGRPSDRLWTGTAYEEYTLWRQRYPGSLTALEEDFTRSMAERALQRRRIGQAILTAVIAVLASVAALVTLLWLEAVNSAQRAEASKLLAIAQVKLDEDPAEALAYTTSALELSDTEQARELAVKALSEGPPVVEIASEIRDTRNPSFSPDGVYLAVAGHSEEVGVWDWTGALVARLPGHQNSPNYSNLADWAGNDLLVTGLPNDTAARIWQIPHPIPLREIDFGRSAWWMTGPRRLCVNRDDERALGPLKLSAWSLPDGEEEFLGQIDLASIGINFFVDDCKSLLVLRGNSLFQRPLPLGSGPDVLIGPQESGFGRLGHFTNPHRIWVRESSGKIRVWKVEDSRLREVLEIPKPETAPASINPEPSGRWLFSRSGLDSEAKLWALEALPGSNPLRLRRRGSWYAAGCAPDPGGNWVACSTEAITRLTFWPLSKRPGSTVEGYRALSRPVVFSPDSRWLASGWGDGLIRLWPVPGHGRREVRRLEGPQALWRNLAFDPAGRYLLAVGSGGSAWIFPLEEGSPRKIEGFSKELLLDACAVSPSGRLVAVGPSYGIGEKSLRVVDVETGAEQVFPLQPASPVGVGNVVRRSGYEGGLKSLAFRDESTLVSLGEGGVRIWDLANRTETLVWPAHPGDSVMGAITPDFGHAFVTLFRRSEGSDPTEGHLLRIDLKTGQASSSPELELLAAADSRLALAGPVYSASSTDGLVRVGFYDGGSPHLLAGHVGVVQHTAVSPDLTWVASAGEDNTLRLWPMPDLSKPPLHTLPHDELLAKLKSLTNLRAVPDSAAENGWRIELDRFPGWREVPTW